MTSVVYESCWILIKKNQFLYFVCAVLLVLGFFSHCRQSIRVFLPGSSPVLAL
jgi:hypothetical protein